MFSFGLGEKGTSNDNLMIISLIFSLFFFLDPHIRHFLKRELHAFETECSIVSLPLLRSMTNPFVSNQHQPPTNFFHHLPPASSHPQHLPLHHLEKSSTLPPTTLNASYWHRFLHPTLFGRPCNPSPFSV